MAYSDEDPNPKTFWQIIKFVFDWYPAAYPAEEKRFLRKLDCSILIYACLTSTSTHFGSDSSNISNAYVSGMKEDLGLYGNELNYFNICYYTTMVVFQIPLVFLLSRPLGARYGFAILSVLWGVVTFCQSAVTNVDQLYALRALVGLFEAPTFAATHVVLAGSWYRKPELFKRAGVWFISQSLGQMFSGYLQAAAYTNLDGVHGMAGWRWLFIIDGVITIPIAVLGFLVWPGIPQSRKVFYFKDAEIELGKRRMLEYKAKAPGKVDWAMLKRVISSWHWWVFVPCFIFTVEALYPTLYMNLWLKADGYSVEQVNNYPTIASAVGIVASWLGTTLAGGVIEPWIMFAIGCTSSIFGAIVMTVWNVPKAFKFFSWCIMGVFTMLSPIIWSTVNVVLKGDAEKRSIVIASMMTFGYAFYIWVPLLLYATVDAPQWKKGWPACIAFSVVMFLLFVVATLLHRRE
ncbi:hypothetical protein A1O1_05434 [Capronia coronata CBS 617.96]|uniref:Major facilitator superfamily (MFS) profile domain-containing protein n=1 Tax=Capronia coronata CBS 617.96 TaxID=1182541 RepID=W9Z1X0_9EURO|nr:uncharacterized protein A1O1_05434 [Capronia coronata CBS 617.96]EXJ88504.1 hypothetical protein A1O1_05434 [Capronia coronata CBS 617.96]